MQDIQVTGSTMQTTNTGGERRAGGRRRPAASRTAVARPGRDGEAEPQGLAAHRAAPSLLSPLHRTASALLVLLAVLGVTCEDKIVIVELCQLAVEELVALKLLGRRKDAATFGALERNNHFSHEAHTHTHTADQTFPNHTPD